MKKIIISFLFLPLMFTMQGQVPLVDDVKETSKDQSRDLSFPESRIVINPFNFREPEKRTASEYSNRPFLPLNTAYLATERVASRRADNLLSLYQFDSSWFDSSEKSENFEYLWEGDLNDVTQWVNEPQTVLEVTDMGLKFSLNSNPSPVWKFLSNRTPISIDMDVNPVVTISVSDFEGTNWSLKMRNQHGSEVILRDDAQGTGTFQYPLREMSGRWTGTQQITFSLYCIGRNSTITINDWKIIMFDDDALSIKEASEYSTAWMPNELPFEASYEDGSSIKGTDYFYDIHTIVRKIEWTNVGNSKKFLLVGEHHGLNISFENNVLIQEKDVYNIAITSNAFENYPIKYYRSLIELRMQINGTDAPVNPNGYWSVEIDADESRQLTASVAFSYANDDEDESVLLERVKEPLIGSNAEIGYQNGKQYWNDYLAKLPHPSVFAIETADSRNVSPDEVKLAYYKAWVFTAQSLLMGDPVKYPYPQVVTGKASVWDEGHDLAPYSATWESFFGIQFLAFTDPENAWKAFDGIMSLTDSEGVIGGESLPSRKAQTAWLLYEMTGDKDRLSAIYDPLERYLNWRKIYPHWIYNSEPDVTQKDAEFVFSAIIDMDFMSKIARVVKNQAVAEEWKTKAKNFYEECLPWFWPTPKTVPVQYYNTVSHGRDPGGRYWVTTGLFMDELEGDYLGSMMNLFSLGFSMNGNFGGTHMGNPKYPDVSYTLYGLIERNNINRAENVIDICIRDIVRSGNFFAECYVTAGEPYPYGVRPSFFGASMIIDFVMMKNGFWYGKGTPNALNLFEGERSIQNIRFGEKTINISRDTDGLITLSGSYLENEYGVNSERGNYFPIKKDGETSIEQVIRNNEKPYKLFSNKEAINVLLNDKSNGKVSFRIFSLNGINMSESHSEYLPDTPISIPTIGLNSGVYILSLEIGEKFYIEKIILL